MTDDENEITEVTRRAIIDQLVASDIAWSGRMGDDEFLSRLYDLAKMPSTDHRFNNATGDIWQHCVRNNDWNPDWVFYDQRFRLLHESDGVFLKFLCETVHPIVRSNPEEAAKLVKIYNEELAADGWELVEGKQISGKPIYGAKKLALAQQYLMSRLAGKGWTASFRK